MNRSITLATLLFPLSLMAQEAARQAVPFTWRERVAAGAWLRVYSTNGRVDALAADGADAEVRGDPDRSGRSADAQLSYTVLRDGNDVVLCVLRDYQTCNTDGISGRSPDRRGRNRDGERTPSVSLTIRVPRGVHLAAHSGNGAVQVSGVTAEIEAVSGNGAVSVDGARARVEARSGNGAVRVTTAQGPVNASTGNGEVWVRMEGLPTPQPMDFHSGNGTITVMLPDGFAGQLEASTGNGDIESDFPITTQGRFSPSRLSGRIGSGGPTIRLRTGNGDIELLKLGRGGSAP